MFFVVQFFLKNLILAHIFFYFNNAGKLDRSFEHGNCYLEQSSKFSPGWKTPYNINLFNSFGRIESLSLDWKFHINPLLNSKFFCKSFPFFVKLVGLSKTKNIYVLFFVFVLYPLHDWHICNHVKLYGKNHKQSNNYQLKYLLLLLIFTNNHKPQDEG